MRRGDAAWDRVLIVIIRVLLLSTMIWAMIDSSVGPLCRSALQALNGLSPPLELELKLHLYADLVTSCTFFDGVGGLKRSGEAPRQ